MVGVPVGTCILNDGLVRLGSERCREDHTEMPWSPALVLDLSGCFWKLRRSSEL